MQVSRRKLIRNQLPSYVGGLLSVRPFLIFLLFMHIFLQVLSDIERSMRTGRSVANEI